MSFTIPVGMTLAEMLRVLSPPAPQPEPEVEVESGVAQKPRRPRKAEAAEES